jgi:phosphoribosyl-AMP cyclohydrolase
MKGESSGNIQLVKNIFIDCDNDTILLQVEQLGGAACHTGHKSCFYRKLDGGDFVIVGEKIFNPEEVYK